jgi:hypothetical protein
MAKAFEAGQGKTPLEQFTPTILSRDPEDYVEVHRRVSLSRSKSQSKPERRKSYSYKSESLSSLQWQHGNLSQTDLSEPKRRKSIFGKLKSFFVGNDGVEHEKDDSHPAAERRRSKSIKRFFKTNQ